MSRLRSAFRGFKTPPGIQHVVLQMLKSKTTSVADWQKDVTLMFDEMSEAHDNHIWAYMPILTPPHNLPSTPADMNLKEKEKWLNSP